MLGSILPHSAPTHKPSWLDLNLEVFSNLNGSIWSNTAETKKSQPVYCQAPKHETSVKISVFCVMKVFPCFITKLFSRCKQWIAAGVSGKQSAPGLCVYIGRCMRRVSSPACSV